MHMQDVCGNTPTFLVYLEVLRKRRQVPPQPQFEPAAVRSELNTQVRRRVCGTARTYMLLV